MRSISILSLAGLAALAAAQPAFQRRDMVTVTHVETVVKTVDITKTIYGGGAARPTQQGGSYPIHHGAHRHHHHHHHPSDTPTYTPTPTPSTTYTPPATQHPTTTPVTTPSPTTYHPPATPTPSPTGGNSPPSGTTHTGDGTYYQPAGGYGSCGTMLSDGDPIVALGIAAMADGNTDTSGNPNMNTNCGKKITINYNGKTTTATVADTCGGCAGGYDVDMTEPVMEAIVGSGYSTIGRVHDVKWWYN